MIPAERNKRLTAAVTCGLLAFGGTTVGLTATPAAARSRAVDAVPTPGPAAQDDVPQRWGDPAQGHRLADPFAARTDSVPWHVVPSLDRLLAELNTLAPDRDRTSDGSIGDLGHSARPSGHNPDETGSPEDTDADDSNEVRARDFDVNLRRAGVTMEMVAQFLVHECRAGRITWIKYIIFNRRIWSASGGWVTRAYTGLNPHQGHMHVSSKADTASENDVSGSGLVRALRREAGGAVDGLSVDRLTGSTPLGRTFYTRGPVTAGWSTSTPSAFISHFDLLVDGRVVTRVPGGRRAAALRLPPGRHAVQVRAVHLSGRSTVTKAYPLIADRTPPAFVKQPVVALRRGTMLSAAPVSLGWQASDPGGVRHVTLTEPDQMRFEARRTGWMTGARTGAATTWTLRATDRSGNVTDESTTRTATVLPETAATRSGAWALSTSPAYLDRAALRSAAAGAALTWTFHGRGASLVFTRTARSGRAVVTVDGRAAATLDLRARSTGHRQVVWADNWRSAGAHTVTVTVQGTAEVISDGLVYLR